MPAINIKAGSMPSWNTQSNNPELFNQFVGTDGNLNPTPGLTLIASLSGTLAMWYSNYDGGSYIVVTELLLMRISPSGVITNLQALALSQFSTVEITENLRFQLTITTGSDAFVFDQVTGTFTDLEGVEGFQLKNAISCTTINSFTVVLDSSGTWQISAPNNAISYSAFQIQAIDSQLIKALAVKTNDNNLFIFGTFGIERWNPTLNTNVYLFPLQKDMDFKSNFGAISTNSIASDINHIYFLSSRYMPMSLDGKNGIQELGEEGLSKAISRLDSALNPLANNLRSCIYTYRSYYFFQMTFLTDNVTWVYCINTKTWCNTDNFILDASSIEETVLKSDGIYSLSIVPDYALRRFVSESAKLNKSNAPNRGLLNGIELNIVQGQNVPSTTKPNEFVELYISTDRVTWSNAMRIPLGGVGARQSRTRWPINISATFITVKIEYQGALDFTIEGIDAYIT